MAEIRALTQTDHEDEMIVEGYAVRFDEPAEFEILGKTVREIIDRSALDNADMRDVPFKYNHSNETMIMARTRSKTLQVTQDAKGLFIRASLANTTAGRDLYELIRRGDVDKMSFAFTVKRDDWDDATLTRRILEIDKLFDVSAVDFPAYDTTSIYARHAEHIQTMNENIQDMCDRDIRARIKIKTNIQ